MPSPRQKHTLRRQREHLSGFSPPLLCHHSHSTGLIFSSTGFTAEAQDGLFVWGHEAAGAPVHATGTPNKTRPCFSAYPPGHRTTCPPHEPWGGSVPCVPVLGAPNPPRGDAASLRCPGDSAEAPACHHGNAEGRAGARGDFHPLPSKTGPSNDRQRPEEEERAHAPLGPARHEAANVGLPAPGEGKDAPARAELGPTPRPPTPGTPAVLPPRAHPALFTPVVSRGGEELGQAGSRRGEIR